MKKEDLMSEDLQRHSSHYLRQPWGARGRKRAKMMGNLAGEMSGGEGILVAACWFLQFHGYGVACGLVFFSTSPPLSHGSIIYSAKAFTRRSGGVAGPTADSGLLIKLQP